MSSKELDALDLSRVRNLAADAIAAARKSGADAADAVAFTSFQRSASVQNGAVEDAEQSESTDIGLRVFVGARAALVKIGSPSGIAAAAAPQAIDAARAAGFTAFKVKIGFDAAADLQMLERLCADLQPGERLACDANQAWDLDAALAFIEAARHLPLMWLEEPIRADAPSQHWAQLAAQGDRSCDDTTG